MASRALDGGVVGRGFPRAAASALVTLAAARCDGTPAASKPAAVPRRICSVNLAADETLAFLVDASRMVGVSALVDNEGLSNVVGRYPKGIVRLYANAEKIVELAPDLVCVNAFNSADFVAQVEGAGIPVLRHASPAGFADVRQGILDLGERVGAPERARAIVAEMDRRLGELSRRLQGIEAKPTVCYWSGAWTAGAGTTIHDIIEHAGGVNIAARGARRGMAQISVERVLADDPDCLLLIDRQWLENVPAAEPLPPQFETLRAVRSGRVIRLPPALLATLSQFVADGAEALARALHPGRFHDAPPPEHK